jgi:hypothetical protein
MSEQKTKQGPTLEEAQRISRELWSQPGSEAEQRLRAKCRWEWMTRPAVIMEWGDPRTWEK